jgi:hypothetical protein
MSSWYCTTCDKTLKASSKYKHLKSKRHESTYESKRHVDQCTTTDQYTTTECVLCTENVTALRSCRSCHQNWCTDCDPKLSKCPYCRKDIPGRNALAQYQVIDHMRWYASSEAFAPIPSIDPTILEFLNQLPWFQPVYNPQ